MRSKMKSKQGAGRNREMSCDKSKIAPMCINCSRYRKSIFYGGHAACNKQKTIIKNGCDVCSDWKLSEQRRKVAIFGECGKSKNVRRRKERENDQL